MSAQTPKTSSPHTESPSRWRGWWGNAFGMLFPVQCVACQKDVSSSITGPQDAKKLPGLCASCQSSVITLGTPLCPKCGHPIQRVEDTPCPRCLRRKPAFHRAWSVFVYGGAIRKVLHRYKLRGDLVAGRFLQQWFRQQTSLLALSWNDYDVVSCVPLHPLKLQERGFNQALQLMLSLPLPEEKRQPFLLDRVKKTKPLYEQNLQERQSHLYQAFVLRSEARCHVSQKRILLIDDVLTSGATAHQCSLSLYKAGATRVDVLTLCRAVV